ncbi:NAD(P)-binding protein [Streptomyces sp. HNM0575]|uniref:FAD-dependent oxidoreductase n=1 Tax=Streptomyces sp. HNM0575 TaxID=2716338 RepID=UPI00145C5DF0|nr:FAD-dependent oxidoreductase [Streptomyces sp. HNM0575]NLU72554.1 NAD(P)-binding protein [Streptomyces sp. HNM0575]
MGRRSVLRKGVLGAAALGVLGAGTAQASLPSGPKRERKGQRNADAPGKRLAIIGAGAAGVATAYFCDSSWSVDLFESRDKIGGHADTVSVTDGDKKYAVDIGAEFFHPNTHPMYWSFLEEIGARTDDPATSKVIEGPASLTVFDGATGKPRFGSEHVLDDLPGALSFLAFTREARKMTEPDAPWGTTMGEWLDGLSIDADYRRDVLTPWLSSLTCGDTELVRTQSARAHLSSFAKTFPSNIFESVHTYNSTVGLEGYLRMLLDACENTNVLTRAAVQSLEERSGTWHVRTDSGRHGPYDAVVVTAPPPVSKGFFGDAPDLSRIGEYLGLHEYHPARLVIHRDPHYMPADKGYWSVQNAAAGGRNCETSIWVGAYYGTSDPATKPNIFKSWAAYRSSDPAEILAERRFRHPLCTPRSLGAARDMMALQGERNLYFAGSFTTITDLQETSLYSGLKVAESLNPEGPELTSFKQRLADDDLLGVSYDVV